MAPKRTRLVAVGACAIDTILTVPHFPEEDSKLRATSFSKRRGGNGPNTLEVLQQLIAREDEENETSLPEIQLHLLVTLPSRESEQVAFITSSLDQRRNPTVDFSHCVYREEHTEPVSSYIISSESSSSRTIINNNALPEMTFEEFASLTRDLLNNPAGEQQQQIWFHFEGRIPETTLQCMRHLRAVAENLVDLKISVELEKPGREGLQQLALEADVVFYSKSWATAEGYPSPERCIEEQSAIIKNRSEEAAKLEERLLICPWGAQGACAAYSTTDSHTSHVHSPAYVSTDQAIIDATGAGDTFIAGMLFGLIRRSRVDEQTWSLRQKLDFANGLAGRKILQEGFRGLDILSGDLRDALDGDAA